MHLIAHEYCSITMLLMKVNIPEGSKHHLYRIVLLLLLNYMCNKTLANGSNLSGSEV